jgi:acetyl/propionyl-CoA carboxylase alpha subunit
MTVSPNYDSLLAKLVVWSETRPKALGQLQQILSQTGISGVHTNLSFLSGLIESEVILENRVYTRFVDENLDLINARIAEKKQHLNKHKLVIAYLIYHLQQQNNDRNSVWGQIGFWRMMPVVEVYVDDEKYECNIRVNPDRQIFRINQDKYDTKLIQVSENLLELEVNQQDDFFYFLEEETQTQIISGGFHFALRSNLRKNQVLPMRKNGNEQKNFQNLICADLFGKVLKLNRCEGDAIQAGEILLTLESMKTEIHVLCPVDARVKRIYVKEGNAVVEKQLLVELTEIS